MSRPKIIFLATEDWFVASHFRPLLARAVSDGFEVVVAARNTGALKGEGVRLVPMPFSRRALAPRAVWSEARAFSAVMRAERATIVHAIALKPIGIALLSTLPPESSLVLAPTGRGYLAARGGWRKVILGGLAARMRAFVRNGRAILLTENVSDQAWVLGNAARPEHRALIMPGAGVDPDAFRATPEPAASPLIVGLASRLVRSKGIDIAVAAVKKLRAEKLDIELHIAGDADADNPDHITDEVIAEWSTTPGIKLLGRVADINAFWASTHIACLPSRGGEGLPRSLLEAGACGRPIVTTDTPGCADFVVPGETGFVVPPENADALANAISTLVRDEDMRRRMGLAARARVVARYTEAHAANVASEAWRRCLALQR